MAINIIKGKDISKIPVAAADETNIIVNEDTLKALSLHKPANKDIIYIISK